MPHKFEVIGNGTTAKILIDGEEVHGISSYQIQHNVCEYPTAEISLICTEFVNFEGCAEIVVQNTELLAKMFDRKQFDDFCRLWEEYHERSEGKARDNRQN